MRQVLLEVQKLQTLADLLDGDASPALRHAPCKAAFCAHGEGQTAMRAPLRHQEPRRAVHEQTHGFHLCARQKPTLDDRVWRTTAGHEIQSETDLESQLVSAADEIQSKAVGLWTEQNTTKKKKQIR